MTKFATNTALTVAALSACVLTGSGCDKNTQEKQAKAYVKKQEKRVKEYIQQQYVRIQESENVEIHIRHNMPNKPVPKPTWDDTACNGVLTEKHHCGWHYADDLPLIGDQTFEDGCAVQYTTAKECQRKLLDWEGTMLYEDCNTEKIKCQDSDSWVNNHEDPMHCDDPLHDPTNTWVQTKGSDEKGWTSVVGDWTGADGRPYKTACCKSWALLQKCQEEIGVDGGVACSQKSLDAHALKENL